MAGACRKSLILYSAAVMLMAMLVFSEGVAHADDVGLPGVSLTSTSGAPLQNGGTYGIGEVIVAHFDAPIGDRGAAEQQLVVSTSPPVSGAWHWVDNGPRTGVRRSTTPRERQSRSWPGRIRW
jgi:Bacterial Ig domain